MAQFTEVSDLNKPLSIKRTGMNDIPKKLCGLLRRSANTFLIDWMYKFYFRVGSFDLGWQPNQSKHPWNHVATTWNTLEPPNNQTEDPRKHQETTYQPRKTPKKPPTVAISQNNWKPPRTM